MKNQKTLIIIAVALIGILAVIGIQTYRDTKSPETLGESIGEIIDSADKGAKEFKEEIKDEIDDHTTDKR